MLQGTAIVMKWLPVHLVAEPLPQSVLSNILTKFAYRSYNRMQYHLFLARARIHAGKCFLLGVEGDENIDAEKFEFLLYGIENMVSMVLIMPGTGFL